MASGLTNRGKLRLLEMALDNTWNDSTIDSSPFFIALVADTPTVAINTFSGLTEIAAGNGYTSGGASSTGRGTGWDIETEDDSSNFGEFQLADITWTASGGSIPGSGSGARYAVLLDDHATVASREVIAWFDLTSARSVGDGATLTLQDMAIRLT